MKWLYSAFWATSLMASNANFRQGDWVDAALEFLIAVYFGWRGLDDAYKERQP